MTPFCFNLSHWQGLKRLIKAQHQWGDGDDIKKKQQVSCVTQTPTIPTQEPNRLG